MYYLYLLTGIALIISFLADRQKTQKALKITVKRSIKIAPAFFSMLVLISIVLTLIPEKMILFYLGGYNKWIGLASASCLGSLTLMPGFIAYPLCGILLHKGVPYFVLAAFTTTLMMVGILTFPVEKEYLGVKIAIVRNVISLIITLIVAFVMGIFFGEIF